MDLVDIDQVLDNLELREAADENNKTAVHTIPATADVSNGAAASTSHCAEKPPGVRNCVNKAFVGVSQVFNSLDDYRRNVESLESSAAPQYDEECRPIGGNASHTNAEGNQRSARDELDHVPVKSVVPLTQEVVKSIDRALNKAHRRVAKYEYDDDADEQEASSDINKYIESSGKRSSNEQAEAEDVTSGSISDSLTTSSSSTFSSGVSPGLASVTDERSTPLLPDDFEERSALLAVYVDQQNHSETVESVVNENITEELAAENEAVEDLACGLSSISITTANSRLNLPCEETVSSVLGNVLEDLSDTTATSLLSQLRKDAGKPPETADSRSFATVSSAYPENDFKEHLKEVIAAYDEAKPTDTDNPATNNQAPHQQSHVVTKECYQQPITFCSTMDDISDTELDSMLQEMDIDDVPGSNIIDTNTSQATESFASQEPAISEAEEPHNSDIVNSVIMEDMAPNSGADLNADSFSQASTVEFSDIRTQSMQPVHIEDVELSYNSVASSYTSSESSYGEGTVGDDEDPNDHLRTRPQRPTTLDLPTLKSASLYANAGQTPPGVNVMQPNGGLEGVNQNGMPNEAENSTGDDIPHNDVAEATGYSDPHGNLGKIPPIWVPDNMATNCMQCHTKFTMIKRRHHCRACGKVLCSVCCSQKIKLEFLTDPESRVCVQCYLILTRRQQVGSLATGLTGESGMGGDDEDVANATGAVSPNPNNPMEYCSTIPPHRQVSSTPPQPPSVLVPVGVLKKDGSYSSNSSNSSSKKGRKRKSVMFSDGIAPGSDLASLENQWSEAKHARRGDKSRNASSHKPPTPAKSESNADATAMGIVAQLFRGAIPPSAAAAAVALVQGASGVTRSRHHEDAEGAAFTAVVQSSSKTDPVTTRLKQRLPASGCDEQGSFIPKDDNGLPPICVGKDDRSTGFEYKEVSNNFELMERLQRETLKFAIQKNFFVYVKIVHLKCCMNRTVINFTTNGLHQVGNDEIIILLEFNPPASKESMSEPPIPKDIFVHLNEIYQDAEHGKPMAELSHTSPRQSNFLGSRDYGGFIFIRTTFQCLQDVIVPENTFLVGILIHRYEVPWAKIFPLRLILRLGAQYRYYPCPHISMRNRESVYAEIAQTIINFLADFRNYSYTLPCIKGMFIHMEDRKTTVLIPRNRQEDVIRAINNASDHILAFGGNFSKTADGHLVCMQNVNDDRTEMYAYSTQAINIQGQPRKVTGASFFVLNEALKTTSGLSGKCSIVEDGLMVQILPSKMDEVRNALRNQKDINIVCGPLDADEQQTEVVSIQWTEDDRDFNVGIKSPIDEKPMDGVSSMRVHASFNYSNANYLIRLTEIYILKCDEWYTTDPDALAVITKNITRISEKVARSTSLALVPFLDLLVASGNTKIGLRATVNQDSVCYEAGAQGSKLPPLYMNALDNHLIPTLHHESSGVDELIIIELIFYILNV